MLKKSNQLYVGDVLLIPANNRLFVRHSTPKGSVRVPFCRLGFAEVEVIGFTTKSLRVKILHFEEKEPTRHKAISDNWQNMLLECYDLFVDDINGQIHKFYGYVRAISFNEPSDDIKQAFRLYLGIE